MFRRHRRKASTPIESLESRSLLTTFTVTTLDDGVADDGETTLREAVNGATYGDAIVFESGLSGVIRLTDGHLYTRGVTITGNGRDHTIIDAEHRSRIFIGDSGLTLQSMTLRNAGGNAVQLDLYSDTVTIEDTVITGSTANGVHVSAYMDQGYGGGELTVRNSTIANSGGAGILAWFGVGTTVSNSTISGNRSSGVNVSGEAGYGTPWVSVVDSVVRGNSSSFAGGGLSISGSLVVANSTITGNSAPAGAGIASDSTFITNSTISSNTASGAGGGIRLSYGAQHEIRNSTISGNSAAQGGGIGVIGSAGLTLRNSTITQNTASSDGGGVYHSASRGIAVESSIIANNQSESASKDLRLGAASDNLRHNLIGIDTGSFLTPTGASNPDSNGNLVGSTASPVDPGLSELASHGIWEFYKLLPDSPAIDRGWNPVNLSNDQIGNARQNGVAVDIGAVEVGPTALVVSRPEVVEGNSGEVSLVFDVEMTEATSGPFTVDVATIDGTANSDDYVSFSGTLSFSGAAGETQQVTVQINGDERVEPNETLFLQFSNLSDTSLELPGAGIGTIRNDDASENITLRNRRLTINGSDQADFIKLTRDGSTIQIVLNDEEVHVPNSGVIVVHVDSHAGDDVIQSIFVSHKMKIDAGPGNDTVKGGLGPDTIVGGEGDDNLRGTKGNDIIFGGDGNDSLQGQDGNDKLFGGDGDDTLKGTAHNDYLRGDAGNDLLDGGEGNDRMIGGGGHDTLSGGAGVDRMSGGGGRDRIDGGDGHDRAGGGAGADTMIGAAGNDYLNSGNGPDWLLGGDGNDTLRGRAGADVLTGDAGDDYLEGLTGRDIIYGGTGADELRGNADDDLLIAGTLTPAEGTTLLEHLSGDLRDEWLSARSYDQRVANILNSPDASPDKLNSVFLIGENRSGQNVFDDAAVDNMAGGLQLDLFFSNIGGDVFIRDDGEIFEAI